MNKKLILTLCLALSLCCTGCNNKSDKNDRTSNIAYEDLIPISCVSQFNTQDEMAQHIISHKDDLFQLCFKHDTQKADPDKLKFFSWGNVSDGYELIDVSQRGDKITMTYESGKEIQPIKLIWKFTADGKIYTDSSVLLYRLTEMSNMKGYYYTISQNENGEEFCDIFWSESGYAFEMQGPSGWADQENLTILLSTTEYPLSK